MIFNVLHPVFSYTSTRMILAALTAFLFTICFGPLTIRCLSGLRAGKSIRVLDLHENKQETPTMGGALFLTAMLVSLLLWMDYHSVFTLMFFITTIVVAVLGGIDDYRKIKKQNSKGIRGRVKMVVLLLLGALLGLYMLVPGVAESLQCGAFFAVPKVSFAGMAVPQESYASAYFIPFWKHPIFFPAALGFFVTLFVVSGTANAVNLTDGLDGLASITSILVAAVLGLFAFFSNNVNLASYLNIISIEGSSEIAIYLFAVVGALLGFLWFNSHPAQMFMGDIGSLTLGTIFAISAVLLRREFLLALVGGIFVLEAISVILQVGSYKLRGGKRIFLCAPIHHHFEHKGIAETKVVVRFAIVGLILALIGLASLKMQ